MNMIDSSKDRPTIPVIIVGAGVNALGAARSLGKAGVYVYLADKNFDGAESYSRYLKSVKLHSMDGEALVDDLVSLSEGLFKNIKPVLFMTQEKVVRAVLGAREKLESKYLFLLPRQVITEALMHKYDFDRLAHEMGVRVAKTEHFRRKEDFYKINSLEFPIIIKPSFHVEDYEKNFRKAYLVETQSEAERLMERLIFILPDLIAQEWVPGGDMDIYFCLQVFSSESELVASFVGKKIRSWPPMVGGTAACMPIGGMEHELTETTSAFFKRLGVCGLASMEYKRDQVTGRYVAIEPTIGRSDYQEEIANLNGNNLPYAYYLSCLGMSDKYPSPRQKMNAIWRDRLADKKSMLHPKQTVHGWPEGGFKVIDSVWRWTDPLPSLISRLKVIENKVRRIKSGYREHMRSVCLSVSTSARSLYKGGMSRNSLPKREKALEGMFDWFVRAQDTARCGGVSAYYDLRRGVWAAAYPETTGYIIPTVLSYSASFCKEEFFERALYMADWEVEMQFRCGGVRAGTIDSKPVIPTVFNTGQVLFGWGRAYEYTKDARYRNALQKASEWLIGVQDDDGAWRRYSSPFTSHNINTYNTRTAYGLIIAARVLDDVRYQDCAVKNVEWALDHAAENGWLPDNDLEDNARPLTHTIAYALRGILEVGVASQREDFINLAIKIARSVARTQRPDGALPGRLDYEWSPVVSWSCITGNAQMAINWLRLSVITGEQNWTTYADKTIDYNLGLLDLNNKNPGVRGGLSGSYPISGSYMSYRYISWASKFMCDAIMIREGIDDVI